MGPVFSPEDVRILGWHVRDGEVVVIGKTKNGRGELKQAQQLICGLCGILKHDHYPISTSTI